MSQSRHTPVAVLFGLSFFLAFSLPGKTKTPLPVFVSIPPQAQFAERVGGPRVAAEVLLPPGANPATYQPTPKQIARLSRAKLYFRIGVPFEEAFLPSLSASLKNLRIVDTRQGITLRRMDIEADGHRHNGSPDPHIWLSPPLVKRQAAAIRDALIQADPAGREDYKKNYAVFAGELEALHRRLTQALGPLKGREIFVYHPAWGYLTDAYGLKQTPVELEGKEPSPRRLARLIKKAKAKDIRVIFVQPQFSRKSAAALAQAIGGTVVPLDPLAKDYLQNMEAMVRAIKKNLEAE